MRTPHYVAEARNRPLTEENHANYEKIKASFRNTAGGIEMYSTNKPATEVDAEERKRQLDYVWETGGLALGGVFTDVGVNKESNYEVSQYVRDKIDEIVEDK